MRTTWFIALALLFALAACAREHITPAFGRANREVLEAQAARPERKWTPPPNMALDAQEAQVIGGSYLHSLAGKQARAEAPPMLIVDPQPQNGSQRLAPSVPKE
jgi:hypothetical protein